MSESAVRIQLCNVGARLPGHLEKEPPTTILPSAWTARPRTWPPFMPGLKVMSRVPSGFSRAMPSRVCPPSCVKFPPDNNLAIGLQGERKHEAVCPWIKSGVDRVRPG